MARRFFGLVRRNALASAALFIVLGGTAFAAASVLPPNSVGTVQLKNRAVTSQKLALGATVSNATHLGRVAPSAYQRRVSGTCSTGSAIATVGANGTVTCQSTANVTQMMGGSIGTTNGSASQGQYMAPLGLSAPNATAAKVAVGTSTSASTARNLQVTVQTAPGSGSGWQFGLVVNGAATALGCNITGTATTCSDTSHTVAIPAGATVEFMMVSIMSQSSSATSVTFGWTDSS